MKTAQALKALSFSAFLISAPTTAGAHSSADLLRREKVTSEIQRRQLKFLENKGQMTDMAGKPVSFVLFKAQAPGMDLYVTTSGLTYVLFQPEEKRNGEKQRERISTGKNEEENTLLRYERVDMELKGATINATRIRREFPETGHNNYFYAHCPDGIYNVRTYNRITITGVYPGIDWVLYNSDAEGFKYDFIVHPGASADDIELVYTSAKKPLLTSDGSLKIPGQSGDILEHAPVSFLKGDSKNIGSSFFVSESVRNESAYETHVKIKVSPDNARVQDLVIDPTVTWGTFFGGNSNDGIVALDCDSLGNLFAVGYSGSSNFPTFNAGTYYQTSMNIGGQVIIKFDNAGILKWATFYGTMYGMGPFNSLTTDRQGNVFVCGYAKFGGMPLLNANTYYQGGNVNSSDEDAFIGKFDNAGNLLWATQYGGTQNDRATDLATDSAGNLFVCGYTQSLDFPLQSAGGFFQSSKTSSAQVSAFVLKFTNTGNRLWATYFGDQSVYAETIAVDLHGNAFVSGQTYSNSIVPLVNAGGSTWFQGSLASSGSIYIAKFSSSYNLLWSTYYGGSGYEIAEDVVSDKFGNLFLMGVTSSTNLPVLNAGTFFQGTLSSSHEIFILKFDNVGTRLWATYLGGYGNTSNSSGNIDLDPCGNLYLSFETSSTAGLPVLSPCSPGYSNTIATRYLCRFMNNGTLTWGTYFGGNQGSLRSPITVDNLGNLFTSGEWLSSGTINPSTYPLVNPGGGQFFNGNSNGSDDMLFVKFGNGSLNSFSYPSLCLGSAQVSPSLSAGFNGGGTFSASPGLSINPVTGQIFGAGSTPGVYTVTYLPAGSIYTCECVASATSTAIVHLSSIAASVNSPTVCLGSPASLISNVNSTSPVSYSWMPQGPVSQSWLVSPASNAVYTLLVKNADGCSVTITSSVTIVPLPIVSIAGATTGCRGDQFIFFAQGALYFQWFNGPASPSLAVIPLSNAGFTVSGIDGNGCSGSASVQVKVNECLEVKRIQGEQLPLVFPNPTKGDFTITGAIDFELSLENENGQFIRNLKLNAANNRSMSVRGLAAGVYIIRAIQPAVKFVQKIIIEPEE